MAKSAQYLFEEKRMIELHPNSTVALTMMPPDDGVQSKQMQIILGHQVIGIGAKNWKIVKHINSFNETIVCKNIFVYIEIYFESSIIFANCT